MGSGGNREDLPPQATFICCFWAVWVGGEKLVKYRAVYCTNRDGADKTGIGKIGGPFVFMRPVFLSSKGRGEFFPSQALTGVVNPPPLPFPVMDAVAIVVALNPAIPTFPRNDRELLRLPPLLYNFVGSD